MARPLKDGVDYWPFDCGLFEDKKLRLIRAEFGIKGAYIALNLLNSVYKENGYFKRWDDEDCYLMSEGVGDGCSPQLVTEVLTGCLRRGLFDTRTFDAFQVLTSVGIQRRYLQMVSKNRQDIPIFEEYWLLEKEDIQDGILNKVVFKKVSRTENPVIHTENPDKSTENPLNKKKENKKKVNERKEGAAAASPSRHRYGQYSNVLLSDEELETLKAEFPVDWSNRIERLSEYIASTGKTYKSHLATLRSWARRDKEKKQEKRQEKRRGMMESSLDLSEYDKWEQSPERYAALSAQLGKGK